MIREIGGFAAAVGLAAGAVLMAQPAVADPNDDPRVGLDCADFATQAEALAHLRSNPADPDVLDRDDDGIPCESRFGDGVSVAPVADPELHGEFHEGRKVSVPK